MSISYSQFKESLVSHGICIPLQGLWSSLEEIASHYITPHAMYLPYREINSCTSIGDAMNLLEKWTLLSPQRVNILQDLFSGSLSVSPHLMNIFSSYQRSYQEDHQNTGNRVNCPCKKLPSVVNSLPPLTAEPRAIATGAEFTRGKEDCFVDDPQYNQIVDYLSEELGSKWQDLGRRLPNMHAVTRSLASDSSLNLKSKIINMLEQHYKSCNFNKTEAIDSLLSALTACNRNRQKDFIRNTFL